MRKEQYCVEGMHCKSCEIFVESQFEDINGISNIKTDSAKRSLSFDIDDTLKTEDILKKVNKRMEGSGYKISTNSIEKKNDGGYVLAFVIALLIFFLYWGVQKTGIISAYATSQTTYPYIFIMGIVASLSSCMAVVGTLVLSFSSNLAKKDYFKTSLTLFHISRLVGFFILGGVLGALGSLITLTQTTELIISSVLFIVMTLLAFDTLGIFPVLKKFQITLPKSISQKMLNTKRVGYTISPILFGIISFFLPCGFTQSMQIQSIVAGDFIQGALTMFLFALGTLPILLIISLSSKFLAKSSSKDLFFKSSGFLILFFAIFNLYGSLVANGIIQPII